MDCNKCEKKITVFTKDNSGIHAKCSECHHVWLIQPIEATLIDMSEMLETIAIALMKIEEKKK